jgi:hypothetical protein
MKKFLILLFCSGLSLASLAQNVVQGEYFIDNDLGYGNNTLVNFTPSPDNSFPITIDISSYSPGYHKLYIRTKDSDGKWSFTLRRNIEVLSSEAKTTIVRGEYFIDTDPGFGMASPITITTPDSIILQNFAAATASLSEGYHKLYGRLMDNFGRWSITFRRNMEVYKDENNKVLNGEYFFTTDNGFGNCIPVTFAVPSADGSFTINIPRNSIPLGADSLFVRVRDDIENRWSITQILNNITGALPLTLLDFTVIKQNDVAQVNWQTSNEVNVSHFNIERSSDGVNFTKVGIVNAKAAGALQNNYSYADDIANLNAGKLYYRLQMVDNDDKFTYSKIVYITVVGNTLITIHPNPAHSYFIIDNYEQAGLSKSDLLIRDMEGRTVLCGHLSNNAGQRIDISNLRKGMYMVNIISNGNVQTKKLVVE